MNNYFQKRALKIEDEVFASTLKFEKKIKKIYKQSQKEIQAEIDRIIREFGAENKLTFQQAKKFIKSERLNVLNSLLRQVKDSQDKMFKEQLELVFDHLGGVYEQTYYKSMYDIQNYVKIYSSVAVIDDKRIQSVLKRKNAGKTFSERIWGDHRVKLFNDVQTQITQSIATGKTNKEIAKAISERYAVGYNNAVRLIRTESNFFMNQADKDSYEDSFIEEYQFLATLDSRTSKICRELDGKIFKKSEIMAGVNFPPCHCNCRSVSVAYIPNVTTYKERVMRNSEGKSVVKEHMNYSDWEKELVK